MNELTRGLPPDDWDETVLALSGNFLQSRVWAQFQQELDRPVWFGRGDGWAVSAAVRRSRGGFRYLAAPYGPTVGDKLGLATALTALRHTRQLNVDWLRLEPVSNIMTEDMRAAGAREFAEVNPQHTHVLDLTKTEDELKSGLESGHRNRINGAARRGISVRQASTDADIETFLRMMHDTEQHKQIRAFADDYYRTMYRVLHAQNAAQLYLAEAESQPVAAALSFDWGPTRYYAHAAANQTLNRKIGASVVLVWQMIMDAKAAGRTEFDFWGVAPAGAINHKWAGISAFKRAFGGQDKTYLGTWDVPIRPLKYQLYRRLKRA